MKTTRKVLLYEVLILCLLVLLFLLPAIAEADQDYAVPGDNYVLADEREYEIRNASEHVDTFFYGSKSMGTLRLIGAVSKVTTRDDYNEYGVNGPVSIYYTYGGSHRETDLGKWYVDDDGMGKVGGYDFGGLFKGVGHGCILIEESKDAKNWTLVQEPKLNYFTEPKKDLDALIYSIPEDAVKNGRYYRVLVAYRFCRKTANGFMFIGDQYQYKKCIELYKFFVSSENNYVTFQDMGSGSPLQDQSSTDSGFIIHKNGSQAKVTIEGREEECNDFDYFSEPGEYTIEVTTRLGNKYSNTITVTNGVDFTPLNGIIYRKMKGEGYELSSKTENTVFGGLLTSLSLVTPKGTEVTNSDTKYGITGKNASLYMKLNKNIDKLGNNWKVISDSWGKNSKDRIDGIQTGEIGKGALIIEKSRDGRNWENANNGKYAKGLYTTDFSTYYGQAENVLIYTPSGDDIINGTYYRILFAYRVYHDESKDYRNYVELYSFYLCNNELGAVTFHNLSVADTLADEFKDADQNTIDVYMQAESLLTGSYTTTGFWIDKKLNPTVKYSVIANDEIIYTNDTGSTFDETGKCVIKPLNEIGDTVEATGKYEVKLVSAVGSTRDVTIYVDRSTPEEAMQLYFGDGFISGKRIFSEGEYPVYEGGKTSYHIAGVNNNVLPLYGQITNLSTGTVTVIEQDCNEKSGVISEPGEYQAVFSTSKEIFDPEGNVAGDVRVFTFRFHIIQEGTAPGPVINQKLLYDYSHSTVTDSNPIYYGLTYSSAEKGHITLAFASREEAVNYAYKYESGTVEKQDNGDYRYTGSFVVDQKTKFNSAWDLTDAVNYFAEAAVSKHFFDMSDEFTYLSLKSEDIETNPNLRQLELPKSVTIFAEGQKEKLTDIDTLPLLNDKPYAYLNPKTGEVERGFYSFEFITDQYGGIDSKTVLITDSEGGQHVIRYSESVGQQLVSDNCPSGIVTVREETMYGDFAEYQAVYIAPGDNQTEVALKYTMDGEDKTVVFRNDNAEAELAVEEFSIVGILDPLDPYAFVVVRHNQNEDVYTAKDSFDISWSDPGEYRIMYMNRLGYGHVIPIKVIETDRNRAHEQKAQETTELPNSTSEPVATETLTTEEPITTDAEVKEQSQETVTSAPDEEVSLSAAPSEQTPDNKESKSENGNTVAVIIAVAVLILLVAAGVLIYRRGKMFARMSDTMKSGEDDKHE